MLLYFLVSFLASIVGAICGVGGGVIIKPVLDLFQLDSVSTISFLSGCTVLSMSCYSVGRSMLARERTVQLSTGTPLAIGAAIGGLIGKQLFTSVKALFENQNTVGVIQAVCLALVTAGTLVYTLEKGKIATQHRTGKGFCVAVGLLLGVMSSFLGIGGGPINLVVLGYFFSMDSKTAAANSLYIILFSQTASFLFTLVSGTVPAFRPPVLALMVCGGVGGSIVGRALSRRMDNRGVDRLFLGLMTVIILICIYNIWNYL